MNDLNRFVTAQEGTYAQVLAELKAGKKTGHWIWWVFPQLAGLGQSATAQRFGLLGLAEATAYSAHPVLGSRLKESAEAMMRHRNPVAVLGALDAMKLRSCLTLFEAVAGRKFPAVALDALFDGERDPETLKLLAAPVA